MKLIWSYMRRHLRLFFSALFFLSVEASADLLQPAWMARIVDRGVKAGDLDAVLRCGAVMLGIAAAGAIGAASRNFLASHTSQLIAAEMRRDLYRKVLSLSPENMDRLQPSSVITRITNDVTQVQNFVNGTMRILVKAPMTCLGALCLMIWHDPGQWPAAVSVLACASWLFWMSMRKGYPRFGAVQRKTDGVNRVSREFLGSVRVVKAFCGEEREAERFSAASGELRDASASAMRVMGSFIPLISLTVNLGILMVLWRAQGRVSRDIGRLMASLNYMMQILFSLGMGSMILNRAVRAAASSERIGELLRETPCLTPPQKGEVPARGGALACHDLSFTYRGAAEKALDGVSFSLKEGETLGIIGPTGAGKSTLLALLCRFYDPQEGAVTLNGTDLRRLDEKKLRSLIALAPQKPLLFTGSVADNLRWGREDASDGELRRALRLACADGFVQSLPDGWDTQLGQGGVNLSGGQKQRLALARALVRRPSVLMLDDCTSALDGETEARVLKNLRAELAGTTVLLVSQRVSAVRRADRILCLAEGRLRGLGAHEALLQTCPAYRDLYRSQIGGDVHE